MFILATSGLSSQNGKSSLNDFGSRPANTMNTWEKSRFSSKKRKKSNQDALLPKNVACEHDARFSVLGKIKDESGRGLPGVWHQ